MFWGCPLRIAGFIETILLCVLTDNSVWCLWMFSANHCYDTHINLTTTCKIHVKVYLILSINPSILFSCFCPSPYLPPLSFSLTPPFLSFFFPSPYLLPLFLSFFFPSPSPSLPPSLSQSSYSKKLKLAKQRSTLQKKKLSGLPSSRVRTVLPKTLMTSFAANQSVVSQASSSGGLSQTMLKQAKPKTESATDVGINALLFNSPSKSCNDSLQNLLVLLTVQYQSL